MKKLAFTLALASLAIVSCSKKEEAPEQPQTESNVMLEEPKAVQENTAAASPEEEGKKLLEGADCLSCHKVDAKLVGPSYQDVAAKYTEADIDHLAGKIIEGGKGVWGDIPMTPHAGLSQDNAKLMVKYILSLKK
ncbi:c-type cytochrome [Elizabethkingia meningoseptica]|uniref:c-type cytochrome n=1 Tax=Elizabethkingia meningoseptica TaxID=238 RepID=UPI000B34ACCB|nr:c-type cytochrome [Elizabethkingia meningoseptica]MDE5437338.1 c-type cytochrome [Elizabethkingia meningoseptica]MDE5450123.1 c-type cytochrome [Elizabethkingia meningoseptica]MDE5510439.1 c-type cytochrome [Elizabethkingia meningoseptica]MDE5514153.1 c-type cytochrome [Elizabethkingia meningoseptica]MDE5524801.1 c-type cytochrome [Elizabethkingia meningoseptica]